MSEQHGGDAARLDRAASRFEAKRRRMLRRLRQVGAAIVLAEYPNAAGAGLSVELPGGERVEIRLVDRSRAGG